MLCFPLFLNVFYWQTSLFSVLFLDIQVWAGHILSQSEPTLTALSTRDCGKYGHHAVCQRREVRERGVGFSARTAGQASHPALVRPDTPPPTHMDRLILYEPSGVCAHQLPQGEIHVLTDMSTVTVWERLSHRWESLSVCLSFVQSASLLTCRSCHGVGECRHFGGRLNQIWLQLLMSTHLQADIKTKQDQCACIDCSWRPGSRQYNNEMSHVQAGRAASPWPV